MPRQNIFELLNTKWDLNEETNRLIMQFDGIYLITNDTKDFTIKEFVDEYCFEEWKNRGRYIDVDDYLKAVDYEILCKISAANNIESFLTVIEIMYNFFYLASKKLSANDEFKYYADLNRFQENMDTYLEHFNQIAYCFEDKEQIIVYENDPAVTAAAEIAELETAFQIVQYNHHSLKGEINKKKKILSYLGLNLEPKRSKLAGINKAISDDIFLLLNSLNIRHNNCDPHSKKYYIKYIADMQEEMLEEWYDELYQLILLANLELDHLERKKRIAELKTHL